MLLVNGILMVPPLHITPAFVLVITGIGLTAMVTTVLVPPHPLDDGVIV